MVVCIAPVNATVAYLKDVVEEDPFYNSVPYQDFLAYNKLYKAINDEILDKRPVPNALLQRLILLNPHQWKAYSLLGDYFYMAGDYNEAAEKYQAALDLRVTSPIAYDDLRVKIDKCLTRLNRFQN